MIRIKSAKIELFMLHELYSVVKEHNQQLLVDDAATDTFGVSIIVIRVFKKVTEDLEADKAELTSGELNPIKYLKDRRDGLAACGKTGIIKELSGDTSTLSPEEIEMLSKFSDEGASRCRKSRTQTTE